MNPEKYDPDWHRNGPPEEMDEYEQELERCAYEDYIEHSYHAAND